MGTILARLFGKLNLGDVIATYFVSRAKLEEMKRTPVGGSVDLPAVKTNLAGGYWEIELGPARRLE